MHSTTININSSIINLINNYCFRNNCLKSEFVKRALRIAINGQGDASGKLTRYQSKDIDEEWVVFHINLLKSECDEFLGARFRLRISLSKLLLIGVILFFKNMKCKTVNFDSYTSIVEKKYDVFLAEEKYFNKLYLNEIKLE